MPVSTRARAALALVLLSVLGFLMIPADVDLPTGQPSEALAIPLAILGLGLLVWAPEAEARRGLMLRVAGVGLLVLLAGLVLGFLGFEAEPQPPEPDVSDLSLPLVVAGLALVAASSWLAVDAVSVRLLPEKARWLAHVPVVLGALMALGYMGIQLVEIVGPTVPNENAILTSILWAALASAGLVAAGLLVASLNEGQDAESM